jgi:phospholipase/lecithinase/hemolysin
MRLILRLNEPAFLPVKTLPAEPHDLASAISTRTQGRSTRRALDLLPALLLALASVVVSAQNYTSIVIFGDSLSDTGNVADLTQAKYGFRLPGPIADYTDGRFTDGTDTVPAAHNYFGVWIEQLASTFPAKPAVKASLDGGTNYAYGFAFTGGGSANFTFGPSDELSVTINNIGQQITDYLATKPRITDKTLFIVWGGANDLLNATSTKDVIDAAVDQAGNLERLVAAGATQFIVPNLPNLGAIPRLNGSPATSIPATKATVLYNSVLAAGVAIVRDFNSGKRLNVAQLDIFGLINKIVASPSKFGLADVRDSSQGNFTVNPDTFLFWDDLHPTTRGHNIIAEAAGKLIAPQQCWANVAKGSYGPEVDCDSAPALVGADQR